MMALCLVGEHGAPEKAIFSVRQEFELAAQHVVEGVLVPVVAVIGEHRIPLLHKRYNVREILQDIALLRVATS